MGPRFPMRGGMPPRMINPMMGRPGMGPTMGRGGGMGPMMGMARGAQPRQGGGLLAKLLGKGKAASSAPSVLGAASRSAGAGATAGGSGGGSFLQTLTNPTAINGFLTNTQKVLNTAQQIGPMVQQYGPMVRNLPAMWKLYKGFKDSGSDTEEETQVESETKEISPTKRPKTKRSTSPVSHTQISDSDADDHTIETPKGQSVPKLYI